MTKEVKRWVGFVLAILVLYALVEGVTVNGKHYGVNGCDGDRGVVIDVGADPKGGDK